MSTDSGADTLRKIDQLLHKSSFASEPVICPSSILELARIFGIDLAIAPNSQRLVRVLKLWLKRIAKANVLDKNLLILIQEHLKAESIALSCTGTLDVSCTSALDALLEGSLGGTLLCSNCDLCAPTTYCGPCRDYLCRTCFERLHRRGRRAQHKCWSMFPCQYFADCNRSALVQCPISESVFCAECYVDKYLPTVACTLLQFPTRIDYRRIWEPGNVSLNYPSAGTEVDWHPFCDKDGLVYYHNFKTSESLRRSPLAFFEDEEPVAEELSDVSSRLSCFTSMTFESPFN
jgi:hypothetical protein